ncbi:MAG TPA: DUF3048 domain-containing protein [Acidimicrobiales bacterium]
MSNQQKLGRFRSCFVAVAVVVLVGSLASCGAKKSNTSTGASPTTGTPPTAPTTTAPPPVFPLTGLPTGAGPATRPALSIKIDNISDALPQSGLNQADIVYEALVEGGLTRLFAVFQSQDADPVGPIRSARPVDADLLDQLGGGIFAYSGAAPGEIAPSQDHSGATLISNDDGVSAFYRAHGKSAPHNVYASTANLYQAGADAGDHSAAPPQLFHYGPATPGTPVTQADVPLGERSSATWHWNTLSGTWDRDQNGKPDLLEDGSQIDANNVLVMSVPIEGSGVFDVTGVEDPLVVVIGQGPCWLLRDGQLVPGTWSRPATTAPTTFTDSTGAQFVFAPGRTFVELEQDSLQPSFQ